MLKFKNARLTTDASVISIQKLDSIPLGDPILQDLECPNCNCPLTFHHSGRASARLVTKVNHSHKNGCVYSVKHTNSKKVKRYSGNELGYLSPLEQRRRAQSAYYEFLKKYKVENNIPLSKRGRSKNSSSKKITDATDITTGLRVNATLHADHATAENTNPHIMHTTPVTLTRDKLNETMTMTGILTNISLNNHQAILTLVENRVKAKMILDEAFFSTASQGFEKVLLEVNKYILKNGFVIVSATVETIPDINGFDIDCMVRTENSLQFNGKDPQVFLYKLNKAS